MVYTPNEIAIYIIGIMIMKTIGYNGVHDNFQTHPNATDLEGFSFRINSDRPSIFLFKKRVGLVEARACVFGA